MDGLALAQAWLRLPDGPHKEAALELLYRATVEACSTLTDA